jgi:hypothetical protein
MVQQEPQGKRPEDQEGGAASYTPAFHSQPSLVLLSHKTTQGTFSNGTPKIYQYFIFEFMLFVSYLYLLKLEWTINIRS